MKLRVRLNSRDEILPGDTQLSEIPTDDGCMYEVTRITELACCPMCGTVVTQSDENPEPRIFDDYILRNEPVTCLKCGDKLLTNARGFRKNPHLDRYLQRKMRGVFDLLIADEVHELAAAESMQGNCFGTIAASTRYTLALTGTLIGGKSVDLHATLFRMSANKMIQRGFNLQNLRGRISPIAKNERNFTIRYGVMEHRIVRSVADDFTGHIERGKTGRRKSYKTDERPRPGISPNLFNHFLLESAVFMSLSDLGPALPTQERILEPCEMSSALKKAYHRLDADLKEAIKQRAHGNCPSLAATRVQVLDAYCDKPWGWAPITAPAFDQEGNRCGSETVAVPEDLGENHIDSKDRKLVEIVSEELRQHRRCAIYPIFTGVHDVRPKLLKLLTDAGVRTLLLPDTVKPESREDWIAKHLSEIDCLIAHPRRVMTGLDLIAFPTLVFFQLPYSSHVLRQAGARARRPTQTMPCKIVYLFYRGTVSENVMALLADKESASQALEGTFDTNALRAMMNGGETDILSTLATQLDSGKKIDARAAWNVAKPKRKPKHTIIHPEPRCWQQGLLFDMDVATVTLAASGE
jgi:hypothetical protein